jgi:hypothetical protein
MIRQKVVAGIVQKNKQKTKKLWNLQNKELTRSTGLFFLRSRQICSEEDASAAQRVIQQLVFLKKQQQKTFNEN